MKKTLFTIAFALVLNLAFAQKKEPTKSELFSSKSGVLIQKDFTDIGFVKPGTNSIKVRKIKYTDLVLNVSQSAIKIEHERGSNSKVAMLDADEIDGAIKSMKLILEKIMVVPSASYKEVSFLSRGGFELGCFVGSEGWATYMKFDKYDDDSFAMLTVDQFKTFLSLLEQSKTK